MNGEYTEQPQGSELTKGPKGPPVLLSLQSFRSFPWEGGGLRGAPGKSGRLRGVILTFGPKTVFPEIRLSETTPPELSPLTRSPRTGLYGGQVSSRRAKAAAAGATQEKKSKKPPSLRLALRDAAALVKARRGRLAREGLEVAEMRGREGRLDEGEAAHAPLKLP